MATHSSILVWKTLHGQRSLVTNTPTSIWKYMYIYIHIYTHNKNCLIRRRKFGQKFYYGKMIAFQREKDLLFIIYIQITS